MIGSTRMKLEWDACNCQKQVNTEYGHDLGHSATEANAQTI